MADASSNTPPAEHQDRRTDERYSVMVPGEVDTLAGPVKVEATDLAVSGVGVSLDSPLLVGSTVRLRLFHKEEAPVAVLGQVVWCSEHVEVGYHAGIHITNIEPAMESRWRSWLHRLS